MKPRAVLINTARGGLVDETALAEALDSGRLAAALLDVVAEEPIKESNVLLCAKNCLITPHVAWAAAETRQDVVYDAAVNVGAFYDGYPDNVVNGVGFIPTPVGGKDNKQVHRVGDCVAIGNLRTVIWRAWDVCMKI